jgi:hypothetical protein
MIRVLIRNDSGGGGTPRSPAHKESLMDKTSVPQERWLYASYSPPHLYEDGTDDGQPIVTALFQEPT